MNSVERRSRKIQEKNPYWSDYICFAEAVSGRKLTRRTISTHFNVLVDKSEYLRAEKLDLIGNLVRLSNP